MAKAWRWGKKVVEIAQELLEGGLAIVSIRQSSDFPPGPQQGRASLIVGSSARPLA